VRQRQRLRPPFPKTGLGWIQEVTKWNVSVLPTARTAHQKAKTGPVERGNGRPLDPDRLTKAFTRARDAAGLSGVRLHDLRHAYGTRGADHGNAATLSQVMGRASVGFTMTTYVHPDAEMALPLATATEEVLGEALGEL
jgi:integrase